MPPASAPPYTPAARSQPYSSGSAAGSGSAGSGLGGSPDSRRSPSGWDPEQSPDLEAGLDSFLRDALDAAKQESQARAVLKRKPQQGTGGSSAAALPASRRLEEGGGGEARSRDASKRRDVEGGTDGGAFDRLAAQAELLDFASSVPSSRTPQQPLRGVDALPGDASGTMMDSASARRRQMAEEEELQAEMAALMEGLNSSGAKQPLLQAPSRSPALQSVRKGAAAKQGGGGQFKQLLQDLPGLVGDSRSSSGMQPGGPASEDLDDDLEGFAAAIRQQLQGSGPGLASRPQRVEGPGPGAEQRQSGGGRNKEAQKRQVGSWGAEALGFLDGLDMGGGAASAAGRDPEVEEEEALLAHLHRALQPQPAQRLSTRPTRDAGPSVDPRPPALPARHPGKPSTPPPVRPAGPSGQPTKLKPSQPSKPQSQVPMQPPPSPQRPRRAKSADKGGVLEGGPGAGQQGRQDTSGGSGIGGLGRRPTVMAAYVITAALAQGGVAPTAQSPLPEPPPRPPLDSQALPHRQPVDQPVDQQPLPRQTTHRPKLFQDTVPQLSASSQAGAQQTVPQWTAPRQQGEEQAVSRPAAQRRPLFQQTVPEPTASPQSALQQTSPPAGSLQTLHQRAGNRQGSPRGTVPPHTAPQQQRTAPRMAVPLKVYPSSKEASLHPVGPSRDQPEADRGGHLVGKAVVSSVRIIVGRKVAICSVIEGQLLKWGSVAIGAAGSPGGDQPAPPAPECHWIIKSVMSAEEGRGRHRYVTRVRRGEACSLTCVDFDGWVEGDVLSCFDAPVAVKRPLPQQEPEEQSVVLPASERADVPPAAADKEVSVPPINEKAVVPPAGEEAGVMPIGEEVGVPPIREDVSVLPVDEKPVVPPAGNLQGSPVGMTVPQKVHLTSKEASLHPVGPSRDQPEADRGGHLVGKAVVSSVRIIVGRKVAICSVIEGQLLKWGSVAIGAAGSPGGDQPAPPAPECHWIIKSVMSAEEGRGRHRYVTRVRRGEACSLTCVDFDGWVEGDVLSCFDAPVAVKRPLPQQEPEGRSVVLPASERAGIPPVSTEVDVPPAGKEAALQDEVHKDADKMQQ